MGVRTGGSGKAKKRKSYPRSPEDLAPSRAGIAQRERPPLGVRRETGGRADAETRRREAEREIREIASRIETKKSILDMGGGLDLAPSLYRKAGRLAFDTEKAWAAKLLQGIVEDRSIPGSGIGLAKSRPIQELAVGTEITKAERGEEYDPRWAAVEAASLLPFTRPFRALRGLRKGSEVVEEVAKTRSPAAEKVRESLASARSRRAAQRKLYREERSRRIGQAEAASERAGGGIAGHKAAKAELAGELPKVKFEKLRAGTLSEDELGQLFRTVDEHPDLRFFEKLTTRESLAKAFYEGRTPTTGEIRHLQTVFGQDAIKATSGKWKAAAGNVINIPRSLMSTLDLSGTLRQALVLAVAHPRIVGRNMKPQVKALVSEKNYAAIMDEIHARPNAYRYERLGLPLTDLDGIATREEQFSSNLAETLTGGKRFSPVRASGRAFTGLLNLSRADAFDLLDDLARAEGHNVESLKFERDLARLVGSMTGRGPLPQSLKGAATFLNTTLFSPRLMAGRIDLLFAPITYARTDPFVRKQALKSMLRLYAAGGVILTLAAAAGAKINLDPRNADFAKVRIGNTRIDIFGGFQQYVRLLAQVATGNTISSTTGKKLTLGGEFGQLSRKDIIERFGVGKFAPPTSFVYDFFKGTDFEGEPFNVKKAALQRLVPFIAQDLADIYRETDSIPAAVGAAALIGLGVGTQTYSNPSVAERAAEKTKKRYSEWESEAKTVWKKAGNTGPLPAELIRAKRASLRAAELRSELKDDLGIKGDLDPKKEAKVLAHVLVEQNPALAQYEAGYVAEIEAADPVTVYRDLLPVLRKRLGLSALSAFGEIRTRVKVEG